MAHRTTLLTGTALAFILAGSAALAQDATIHYTVPTLRSGQPVPTGEPMVRSVPVYSPVSPAAEAGAPVPATVPTVADSVYLTTPQAEVSTQDPNVSFVSGGTGAYEKSWFDAHAREYGLKVTYADTTGHHLAGVDATLSDSAGTTVLATNTNGPYLLVKAKPGTYSLTSVYEGQTQTRKVTIGKGLSTAGVTFKDTENNDGM